MAEHEWIKKIQHIYMEFIIDDHLTGSLLLFLPLFSTEVQLKPSEIPRMEFFYDNS